MISFLVLIVALICQDWLIWTIIVAYSLYFGIVYLWEWIFRYL